MEIYALIEFDGDNMPTYADWKATTCGAFETGYDDGNILPVSTGTGTVVPSVPALCTGAIQSTLSTLLTNDATLLECLTKTDWLND